MVVDVVVLQDTVSVVIEIHANLEKTKTPLKAVGHTHHPGQVQKEPP